MGGIRSSFRAWPHQTTFLGDEALLGEKADAAPGSEKGFYCTFADLLAWMAGEDIEFTGTVQIVDSELLISRDGGASGVTIDVDSSQIGDLMFQADGLNAFAVRKTNSGTFQIKCYDASTGLLLRNALQIDPADGLWTTTGDMKLSGGRLYGTALHNPASGMAGATNQFVGSGTYTPTLTSVTNIAGATAYESQYIRVGNVVTVSGQIDIDPTANSVATELGISLPIASDLAAARQCAGTACAGSLASMSARIAGDLTNNRASLTFVAPADNANRGWSFHFTYLVL